MSTKKRVAFILHPLSVNEFKRKTYLYEPFGGLVYGLLTLFHPSFVKAFYSHLPSHLFLKENNLQIGNLKDEAEIDLLGIMCPVFPEQVIQNKYKSFKKIKKAIKLGIKHKSDVIVLTGFTSMITEFRNELDELLRGRHVSLTSGNALTAILSVNGIDLALKRTNKDPKNLVLAIIGASGDIGSLSVRLVGSRFKKIILCARNIESRGRLDQFLRGDTQYERIKNINDAVKEADVILLATSSYLPLIEEKFVKAGAVICDTSLPHNVEKSFAEKRTDVLVFDGGLADIKFRGNSAKLSHFLRSGGLYGCIAEGVLLGAMNIRNKCLLNNDDLTDKDLDLIISGKEKIEIDVSPFTFHGVSLT